MPYLLDSNIFIQAKNLHYSFDFCPAFWEWLDAGNRQGKVFSIEKVRDELIGGGRSSFFLPTRTSSRASLRLAPGPGAVGTKHQR